MAYRDDPDARRQAQKAAADLQACDEATRKRILKAMRENRDTKGGGRYEITTPLTKGSRRHPWG
jgi:hypothetical protein